MKKYIAVLGLGLSVCANAQTNTNIVVTTTTTTAVTPLNLFTSYLTVNDTNYNGWTNNHLVIGEAAVFQNVNGVQGASAVGNVMYAEIPVLHLNNGVNSIHIDSLTDFETVFGDVQWQGIGVGYDYNLHQIQLSAGADVNLQLNGPFVASFAPYIELKKAATQMGGTSPFLRYEVPINKTTKAGLLFVGVAFPF